MVRLWLGDGVCKSCGLITTSSGGQLVLACVQKASVGRTVDKALKEEPGVDALKLNMLLRHVSINVSLVLYASN